MSFARSSFNAILPFALLTGCAAGTTDASEPGRDSADVRLESPEIRDATFAVEQFYGQSGPSPADYADALTPELDANLAHANRLPDGSTPSPNIPSFLCARDFPSSITVDPAKKLDEATAMVTVHEDFRDTGGLAPVSVSVFVRLADAKITGWSCGEQKHTPAEAEKLVTEIWGKEGPGDTTELGRTLGPALRSFIEDGEVLMFHPLTCAQDVPLSVEVDPALHTGDRALVRVHQQFIEDHPVTVTVSLDTLTIDGIGCGS
jgi:hypothetical protein